MGCLGERLVGGFGGVVDGVGGFGGVFDGVGGVVVGWSFEVGWVSECDSIFFFGTWMFLLNSLWPSMIVSLLEGVSQIGWGLCTPCPRHHLVGSRM